MDYNTLPSTQKILGKSEDLLSFLLLSSTSTREVLTIEPSIATFAFTVHNQLPLFIEYKYRLYAIV
jgi:hypothetical protein